MILDRKIATKKSGNEKLTFNKNPLEFSLQDFWSWNMSDVLSNATRGIFAEYIVGTAIGLGKSSVRDEWGAYDLETNDGIKLEIKSSAYLQSWYQRDLSKISFSTKAALYWDSETNLQATEKKRHADVYVFCLLHHKDKETVDPLNLDQWKFYILSTKELNDYKRSQHSITLNSLEKLTDAIPYDKIKETIEEKNKLNKK
jgi:hypothetical protein